MRCQCPQDVCVCICAKARGKVSRTSPFSSLLTLSQDGDQVQKQNGETLASAIGSDTEVWSHTKRKSKAFTASKQTGTQLYWVNALRLMLRPTRKKTHKLARFWYALQQIWHHTQQRAAAPPSTPSTQKKILFLFFFFFTLGTAKQMKVNVIFYHFFLTKRALMLVYTSEIKLWLPWLWRM